MLCIISFQLNQSIHCWPVMLSTQWGATSFFYGHSKRSAWKTLLTHHQLLCGLGDGIPTPNKIKAAEMFVCIMYGPSNINSTDTLRCIKFCICNKQEMLPPTSGELHLHIKRAHYQCMVWEHVHCPVQSQAAVTEMGWVHDGKGLHPILMTNAIPQTCLDIFLWLPYKVSDSAFQLPQTQHIVYTYL